MKQEMQKKGEGSQGKGRIQSFYLPMGGIRWKVLQIFKLSKYYKAVKHIQNCFLLWKNETFSLFTIVPEYDEPCYLSLELHL